MSGGATQRSRTGPRSLISRQLIRAALRALINGPMEAGSSERQGRAIMCRFDSRSLPGGRSRPRHHGPAPSSGQRGPATATLALNGKPTPHRGGPREAGCGVLGVFRQTARGWHCAAFWPRDGLLPTRILVRSRVGSLASPQLGGRGGWRGPGGAEPVVL